MTLTVPTSDASAARGAAVPCGLVVPNGSGVGPSPADGVVVVDLPLHVDGADLTDPSSLYDRLRAGAKVSTSTPSPGVFLEAFRECGAEHIVCLTMPGHLSATDSTARLAARMLAEEEGRERVTVLDTGTAAAGLGLVARAAIVLCRERRPADEVIAAACRAIGEVRMYGALDSVEYVARSGRIPMLFAGLSDVLRIHPVFCLHAGAARRVILTRTRRGMLESLVKTATEMASSIAPRSLEVLVFHADAEPRAVELRDLIAGIDGVARTDVVPVAPLIGAYTGPGAIGYAAAPLATPGTGAENESRMATGVLSG